MIRTLVTALFALGCSSSMTTAAAGTSKAPPLGTGQAEAIFAGGCFWCMEKPFDLIDGVVSTTSGYTGGPEEQPSYEQVANHKTHHYEAVRVVYDPKKVDFSRLLQVFWHNVDPTDANGQFCDKGEQYRTAIFTSDKAEVDQAERGRDKVAKRLGQPVVTEVLPKQVFWVAEGYHQDYYVKSPGHYTRYRTGCQRDARLRQLWGDQAGR